MLSKKREVAKTKKVITETMMSGVLDQSFWSVRIAIITIATIQTKANIPVLQEAFTFMEIL